jgi:hypothetical protein
MTAPPVGERTRAIIEANGFDPDALEANRAGRLVPTQGARLRSQRRARGWALLVFGGLLVGLGAWDLLGSEGGKSDAVLALIGGTVIIALRWTDFGRSRERELAAGRVTSVDGRIEIHTNTGDNHTAYFYRIEGREFETTEEGAKEIDAKALYRVYYVPESDMMVNVEALG